MNKNNTAYIAAVVQASPIYLDLDATINKAVDLIAQAARQGAKIIAFSELFFPGYPWFLWLGTMDYMTPFIRRYHEQSMIINSLEYQRIQQAAKDNHIFISFGLSELDAASLYIAQVLISDKGETVYTRRKLKPTCMERVLFGEGDGSSLVVSPTALGNIGSLCCGEHLQPLSKYALYAQNEQLHIAAWPAFSLSGGEGSHVLSGEVNIAVSQVYAVEGQCYVLVPCATVSRAAVALFCFDNNMKKTLSTGGGYARIFGPDGKLLVTPLQTDEEGILYAQLDLSSITMSKFIYDPAGHYSRPDVTRLLLDPNKKEVVIKSTDLPDNNVILQNDSGIEMSDK
ncbi:carbon-nitrogen hydrolase family protein [Yersinia kristensenii]|uniref:carbon-nitrogen hydrolase family protein n=1 Tax=Yersinia kristensenii TaxID=28152 RepID=UPI00119E807C|nr:carbon-nitrogen hydrolase family protein [Yersinia kristensenii]